MEENFAAQFSLARLSWLLLEPQVDHKNPATAASHPSFHYYSNSLICRYLVAALMERGLDWSQMPLLSPTLPVVPPCLVVLVDDGPAFGTLVVCSVLMTPHLRFYENPPQREKQETFEAGLEQSASARLHVRLAFAVNQHLQLHKIAPQQETREMTGVPLESSATEEPHIPPVPSGALPHAAVSASRLVHQAILCLVDGSGHRPETNSSD